ncbi:MAG: hypothetical protein ChlgKO_09690 [Chlamydiales bacterium]
MFDLDYNTDYNTDSNGGKMHINLSMRDVASPRVVVPIATLAFNVFSTVILKKKAYDTPANYAAIFTGCSLITQCLTSNKKLHALVALTSMISTPIILMRISKNPQTIEDAIKNKDLKAIERLGKQGKLKDKSLVDLFKRSFENETFQKSFQQLISAYNPKSESTHKIPLNRTKVDDQTRIKIFEIFVRYGANLGAKDHIGFSFIHYLAQRNDLNDAIINFLTKHAKFDATLSDPLGNTPLHLVSHASCNQKFSDLLFKNGAKVNDTNSSGAKPIHSFAGTREKKIDYLDYLIKKGADINATDREGNTPLHYCVKFYDTTSNQIIRNFLEKGADVNATNLKGEPPLFVAAHLQWFDAFSILIDPDVIGDRDALEMVDGSGHDLLNQIIKPAVVPITDKLMKLDHLLDKHSDVFSKRSWEDTLYEIFTKLDSIQQDEENCYSIIFKIFRKQKIDIVQFFEDKKPLHTFFQRPNLNKREQIEKIVSLASYIDRNLETDELRGTIDFEKLNRILKTEKDDKTILDLITELQNNLKPEQQEQIKHSIITLKKLSGIPTISKGAM